MEYLSKKRTIIMGFAIIWIMLFHIPGLSNILPKPISFFINIGYVGVDIFLFLSSYGLYYSLKKDSTIRTFYQKRITRILPTYYIILIIFGIINGIGILEIIKQVSMLGYFFPFLNWKPFDWYIPSLLFFYLIFPLVFKYIDIIYKYIVYILLLNIVFYAIIYYLLSYYDFNTTIRFSISRISIFLLGALYAYKENYILENYKKKQNVIFLIISLISYYFLYYSINDNKYLTLSGSQFITLVFIVPNIIIFLQRLKFGRFEIIKRILEFSGKYSLELYLIHWNLYRLRKGLDFENDVLEGAFLIICFFISFPLARILNALVNLMLKNEKNFFYKQKS